MRKVYYDQLEQFKSISSDFETTFLYEGYPTMLGGRKRLMLRN